MEVVKKGSKGEAVKTLQKALGITADGVFGTGTEKALIAWQKEHSLTADGICGNATWKALGVTEESKCVDSSVVYNPLSVHISKKANRRIDYIVIHYTGGSSSKTGRAMNMKSTFEKREASADFGVDDGTIVQFNPDIKNYYCWSVGGKPYGNKGGKYYGKCQNNNSISIEICSNCNPATKTAVDTSNHSGWSFTEEELENARKLVRILMKKFNVDIDHVIRHYDVTGKLCPALIGWNDEPLYTVEGKKTGEQNNSDAWKKFKASI